MYTDQEFITHYLPLRTLARAICRQLLQSEEEAEDAVQDIYLKLWHRRSTLGEVNNPRAFVSTTSRHHCLDILKGKGAKVFVTIDDEACALIEPIEERIAQRETLREIRSWMQSLREPQRSILARVHFGHEPPREVAASLGLSEGNLRVILSRLRKEMKQKITRQ